MSQRRAWRDPVAYELLEFRKAPFVGTGPDHVAIEAHSNTRLCRELLSKGEVLQGNLVVTAAH